MRHIPPRVRLPVAAFSLFCLPAPASAQETTTLAESFRPGHAYKVDVSVKIDGKLALPTERGKPPPLVPVVGVSRLTYDERLLESDDANSQKAVRAYREVTFKRVTGTVTQDAGIRPSVRRMVLIRANDRRAPFSPDGPLTWGEMDVVRTDVFLPAAVPGLLPQGPVKAGQTWKASAAAVAELTDMQKVDEGDLVVKFEGVATVDGKRVARLHVAGKVRGVNEDGPNRQTLDGTAYFNLEANLLTYLSVRGTHELLDGTSGQTMGVVEGQFVMSRSPLAEPPADLSDASLRGLGLKPDAENTLMLYDDPGLGVRFLYPRGWRVGAVQGKQVTLDHTRLGGGVLITVEPPAKVPTADDYRREVTGFLGKELAAVKVVAPPARVRPEPGQLDRFTLDAAFEKDAARLEYAVLRQADGGATVAARLPAAVAAELKADVERVMRSLSVTKRIEEK
jgi:hypothetical protein